VCILTVHIQLDYAEAREPLARVVSLFYTPSGVTRGLAKSLDLLFLVFLVIACVEEGPVDHVIGSLKTPAEETR